jgi:cytochrome P450
VSQLAPKPDSESGLLALRAMMKERHPLAAMEVFHARLGDIFQVDLPGFRPVVMVGPEAARFVLVQAREDLRWRNERDPVTDLLGHGVLVEDGESHDRLRGLMAPSLHRRMLQDYTAIMHSSIREVVDTWRPGETVDMLVEMRKIALLILARSLFGESFSDQIKLLWSSILGVIQYISPGLWMLLPRLPRPQYQRSIQRMDTYLFELIRRRRQELATQASQASDMLATLIESGLEDSLIRDQLLTMLIAGHDTSTALLSWTWYLLGSHPEELERVAGEVVAIKGSSIEADHAIKQLPGLDRVLTEALRLYPPIHLGSRVAARELEFQGYHIPADTRVIYSIYLTQRHPDHWEQPAHFDPDRHLPGRRSAPYTWIAFGGGPRNCIGAAFGRVESLLVMSHILARYHVELVERNVHPHMGATLEPRPGVRMRVSPR